MSEADGDVLSTGEIVGGKYRVERVIGRGGMGLVFAAEHVELGHAVAIKLLLPSLADTEEWTRRLMREARAAVAIRSEHVARVLDVGKLPGGAPYIVMERLFGTDLDEVVQREGPLPIDRACDYLLQACEAVAEAHSLGIVHRDLKPSNLFLTHRPDGSALIKVLDFGISKSTRLDAKDLERGELTHTEVTLGSPRYMSPEQLRSSKSVDERTDIWSLGMILHRLLTGRPAFEAETVGAHLAMLVADPPTPLRARLPDAPEELERLILHCLEKDPARRVQNVAQLARGLAAFAPPEAQACLARIVALLGESALAPDAGPVARSLHAPDTPTRRDEAPTVREGFDDAPTIPQPRPTAATTSRRPRVLFLSVAGGAVAALSLGAFALSNRCVDPTAGMRIVADTRLCKGTFELPVAPGGAAIEIAADGVTLECDGTILDGMDRSPKGGADTTVGIRVGAHRGVTIRGCGARRYRHGLAAIGATDIHVDRVHLDDNFHDPKADWLGDTRGGGLLLENVTGGTVEASTFDRTWNGIELRGTSKVTITRCAARHASNAGVLLLRSHENVVSHSDLSWAVRGDLSWPDRWYGVDTKDSAGIIVDDRSSKNRVHDNDLRWGGDGIFVRGLTGLCARDNVFFGNDVSFSPHNGIECTCDDNTFENNVSIGSHYGVWAGGAERMVLKGNRIEDSKVDGISIQVWESRHVVIDDNRIVGSGRAGILFSGRTHQQWQPLSSPPSAELSNESHALIQRNKLDKNGAFDIFVRAARSVVILSNCGIGGDLPKLDLPVAATQSPEHEVIGYTVGGNCTAAGGRTPPTAVLAELPAAVRAGESITIDASASAPSHAGDRLVYHWLVQRAWPRYVAAQTLPPPIFAGQGPAKHTVTLVEPGLYDVGLTVEDGVLGAIAHRQVAALPRGVRIGDEAADWDRACDGCTARFEDVPGGLEGSQVHVVTDLARGFGAVAPRGRKLGIAAGAVRRVSFFVRVLNTNEIGWRGGFPEVVVASAAGSRRYRIAERTFPVDADGWMFVDVPLAGGEGWTRQDQGDLATIDWIEIRAESWGRRGYELWLDAVTLRAD